MFHLECLHECRTHPSSLACLLAAIQVNARTHSKYCEPVTGVPVLITLPIVNHAPIHSIGKGMVDNASILNIPPPNGVVALMCCSPMGRMTSETRIRTQTNQTQVIVTDFTLG